MKGTSALLIALVAVLIILVVAAAFFMSNPVNNPSPSGNQGTNNTNPSGGQGPTTSTASVSIKNLAFDPTPINIAAGTTVTWTNNDSVTHTVTSDSDSSESFDSGHLAPGATFTHTFNNAGTISYHCTIHPFMHGQVIVS